MFELSVEVRYDPDLVVVLRGELDATTAARVRTVVDAVFHDADLAPATIAFDLRDLRFIDSTGIAVLVRAKKLALRKGGTVVLRDVHDRVARVLLIAGLGTTFVCRPPLELLV